MNLDIFKMAENDARQQSLIDLENLYVWLQQFEDPTIGNDESNGKKM